jgi:hypothetical protein
MRTNNSQRVLKNLLGALDKADFKEELHPRARTGKFAKKPGKGGVGAIGAIGAVGGMKVRAVRLPVHLRRATPAEWEHEKKRVHGMTPAQLQTRMNKITQPQKMKNFAEALEDENFHDLAKEAFGRLRAMGFEENGAPAGRAPSVETPRPAPRPQPPKWRPIAIAGRAAPSPSAQQRAMEQARAEGLAQQARRDAIRAEDRERQEAARRAQEEARRKAEEEAKKPLVIGERSAIKTTKEDIEKMASVPGYLVKATTITKPGERYSGESFKVKTADGKTAVWKAKAATGLEKGKYSDDGSNSIRSNLDARIPEYQRDLAAYLFSEEMGMGVVPTVIKANLPIGAGGEGHLMAWVDGKTASASSEYSVDARKGHIDLQRIAALDFIVGNTDRHNSNFMHGKDGRYYAIDDGLTFPKDSDLAEFSFRCDMFNRMDGRAISPQVKDEVERLTPERITAIMRDGGFHQEDIDGTIARREVFLGMAKFRAEQQVFTAATSIASTLRRERMAEAAVRRY